MPKTILAVCAHPDDLEFACSITIKKMIEQGYEAYYVIATNGENGYKITSKNREERIKTRKKEQLEAAEMTGVKKVYFLDERDGFLQYKDSLRKKLTALIKKHKPEIVFTFDPANTAFDNLNLFHRDHRVIALACFDACFAAKNDFIYPSKEKLHRVKQLYLFGSDKPNTYTNVTDDMKYKMEILKCYKSQFPDFPKFEEFFKKNLSRYTKKYKYSEAFRILDCELAYY